ncbi:hypothetical protein [Blastococcus brunescens]|uniref:Uncharacterized protein n=1 Tax=Blastococcus brunescens TaxID=1564165 RepID=A0ABZ1B0C1_9ACTN|nr:hypothetical protein [Blastococcus sp. BMG 8361]WRL64220.1 hypothetical protein U6N30_32510 [Blastococcus sp. BMG 8361]
MLIGAWAGSDWIRRAAEEFDGWICSAAKGGRLAEGIALYRAAGGRRAMVTNISVDLGRPEEPPAQGRPSPSSAGRGRPASGSPGSGTSGSTTSSCAPPSTPTATSRPSARSSREGRVPRRRTEGLDHP